VTVGGAAAPVGTIVEAFSPSGNLVGRHTVTTAGYYGYMRIYGEDATGSPIIPGMRAGEAVSLKVNGISPTTAPSPVIWQNDPTPREVGLKIP
jgi:hypothetical protein